MHDAGGSLSYSNDGTEAPRCAGHWGVGHKLEISSLTVESCYFMDCDAKTYRVRADLFIRSVGEEGK